MVEVDSVLSKALNDRPGQCPSPPQEREPIERTPLKHSQFIAAITGDAVFLSLLVNEMQL